MKYELINLTKIEDNIRYLQKKSAKEIMAVLKTDAYGMGILSILPLLKRTNIHQIALLNEQEYIKYQDELKEFKVLILDSCSENFIMNHSEENLMFSIADENDFELFQRVNTKRIIHLRVETGLNRFGLRTIESAKRILEVAKAYPNMNIIGVYSHFSSCEKDKMEKQAIRFREFIQLAPFLYSHICATSSLTFDCGNMARIGFGLYSRNNEINTISLLTYPKSVYLLKEDEQVGYDPGYPGKKGQRIAVIDVGYSDIEDLSWVTCLENKKVYQRVAPLCMNHFFLLVDQEINKHTCLRIEVKNDIIKTKINPHEPYVLLLSLRNLPKIYLRRKHYDLPKIFKTTGIPSYRFRTRNKCH